MKSRFAYLLQVKSIVTLVLTGVYAYLAIAGMISAENYMSIYTLIIGFYFGATYQKPVPGNK